ncbi:MAG: hypothetical protein EBT98_08765 [Opitutaceae bacterium]|nr:hypothetical protein [Opitutaceae bacterium]NBR59155.1 hypothetical protein [Opitutaceae bacterium]
MTATIPTLLRDNGIGDLFASVVKVDASLNSKLGELAESLAAQVESFDLPHASKISLIESAYSADFKLLSANRNTVASLRALLVAKVAGNELVEVSAPSQDGKKAGISKPANILSAGEAKKLSAQIKQQMIEAERSPEEEARAEALAKSLKQAAQKVANDAATKAVAEFQEKALAFAVSEPARAKLAEALAAQGWKIIKDAKAPTK